MTEKVQKTPEEIEQLAFGSGFEDENAATGRTQPESTKPEGQQASTSEAPKIDATKPEAKPEPKKPPQVKPKDEFVRVRKDEYETLKTNAGKVPELEKGLEKAFAKFGPTTNMLNELKATVETLRTSTPKGQAVELPADVVSELEAEFPELAGGVKAALTKALKGLIGTGKESASEDAFDKKLEARDLKRAAEDLEEAHPKWREIVGAVADPSQVDAKHPFRAWLAKQPADYQNKINETRNPTVISNAITKFMASQPVKKPGIVTKPVVKLSKKALRRQARLRGSVQPKGLGSPPPVQRESVEDAFAAGFRQR